MSTGTKNSDGSERCHPGMDHHAEETQPAPKRLLLACVPSFSQLHGSGQGTPGCCNHIVLGQQPKLSLQRFPLTGSPESPMQGLNFMTASTGRNQGVRGALQSLIPADCRFCGHHKPGNYYLPWAQGWVAQRIDSEEQSLLHICQLKSCPRQRGSNMHPGVFPAATVLYPGAPAAGKHFLLHLPHRVPACSAPQGDGQGGVHSSVVHQAKGQLGHGFGSLSPKVLPPLCSAGSKAQRLLPPALMRPDRCRSPEVSEWGIYSGRVRMRCPIRPAESLSCQTPALTPFCSPQYGQSSPCWQGTPALRP